MIIRNTFKIEFFAINRVANINIKSNYSFHVFWSGSNYRTNFDLNLERSDISRRVARCITSRISKMQIKIYLLMSLHNYIINATRACLRRQLR